MVDSDALDRALERMCAEYLEMPGLRLTLPQAQRLWGLDEPTCVVLLDALVETGFLRRGRDATYTRASDGPAVLPRPRVAKATLRLPLPIAGTGS